MAGEQDQDLSALDSNQLQTALNNAIMSEDYGLAARLRNQLQGLGEVAKGNLDWRSFGCPEWLAERAEQLGFKFPTGDHSHLNWSPTCCPTSSERVIYPIFLSIGR